MHARNRPTHNTLFDKTGVACTITNSVYTHGQSAPESTSASTPADDRVAASTLTQVGGTTVALWSMFGDQQPKRKETSREPDKAMSEPGEVKLLDAVAMLT